MNVSEAQMRVFRELAKVADRYIVSVESIIESGSGSLGRDQVEQREEITSQRLYELHAAVLVYRAAFAKGDKVV